MRDRAALGWEYTDIQWDLAKCAQNKCILCLMPVAFPVCFPPSLQTSRSILRTLLEFPHGFFQQHHFLVDIQGLVCEGLTIPCAQKFHQRPALPNQFSLLQMPAALLPWELHPWGVGGRAGWKQMGPGLPSGCASPSPPAFLPPCSCSEGLIQDCPALSKPGLVWPDLLEVPVQVRNPQPDPRSLNQQQLLPVPDWSFNG